LFDSFFVQKIWFENLSFCPILSNLLKLNFGSFCRLFGTFWGCHLKLTKG